MKKPIIFALIVAFLPLPIFAQVQANLENFHVVLDKVKRDMIPMASDLLGISQTIAAFGALWYIALRIYKHLAAAEPIDFYPLFRPFAICIAITLYVPLVSLLNDLLSPTEIATKAMVSKYNNHVQVLLEHRMHAITGNNEWNDMAGGLPPSNEEWQKYEQQEDNEGMSFSKAFMFSIGIINNTLGFLVKLMLSVLLQILYYAAVLCIDALRTFNLIILALLGPFVLCLSVYDGFQKLFIAWLTRYINVFLWLPIANLLGAMLSRIQAEMLKIDIGDIGSGNAGAFGQTDIAYMIFLVVGIIGYFSVPSIANYVVQVTGGNAIVSKTNSLVMTAGKAMI
ncbi:conjugative transposon protein TraJ [Paraflavitalea sp. CAU 1676]|uniref:conjugative transposon protein TraJ n=1 Tax=Paraflavitalea sp. CAU 1676 TaxID=3032598 RepID=UPI0023DC6BFB|nr:conjugative transposon protein TraJ [Paraflavitalea sp. CAU 1676]MDF2191370.1 conjugative transposon protein TraJ [Paraflavitalea sp. CAU 1676]